MYLFLVLGEKTNNIVLWASIYNLGKYYEWWRVEVGWGRMALHVLKGGCQEDNQWEMSFMKYIFSTPIIHVIFSISDEIVFPANRI